MADGWCGEALGGRGRRAPRLHHHQQRLEQGDEEDFYDNFTFTPQASEAGRFTPRRLDERRRCKAGGKPTSRQAALHRLSDGVLDVAVVGGTLEAANNAVLLASRGLKVAIITSDDFESGSWSTFGGRQLLNVDRSESSGREWRLLDTAPHLASVGKLILVPPSLPSLLLLFLTTRWDLASLQSPLCQNLQSLLHIS